MPTRPAAGRRASVLLAALSLTLAACDASIADDLIGGGSSGETPDVTAPVVTAPEVTTPEVTDPEPETPGGEETPETPGGETPEPETPGGGTEAPSQSTFYADPNNSAALWAAANSGDSRAAVIGDEIGDVSIAKWFGDWSGDVEAEVSAYIGAAEAAGAMPVLVAYNVPDRDCGMYSAGGAADYTAYEQWINSLAAGLGDGPAYVMLEPDSIALNGCAGSERNDALAAAVTTIKATCDACQVYLDAGHSSWVPPAEMAARLVDAGVTEADGFFSNVSNYQTTEAEQAYGAEVLAAIGGAELGQVIDTSRNGNGPAPDNAWCDPDGRAIGAEPTTATGFDHVDALLWIKVPGEADGCIAGAGQFVPDRAYQLATS